MNEADAAAGPVLAPDLAADDSVARDVRSLLEQQLLLEVPDDTTDLFEEGVLDSLGLVELLVELEERFGVAVPAAELDVNDFRSVEAIAGFVTRLAASTIHGDGQGSAPIPAHRTAD